MEKCEEAMDPAVRIGELEYIGIEVLFRITDDGETMECREVFDKSYIELISGDTATLAQMLNRAQELHNAINVVLMTLQMLKLFEFF